MVVLQRRFRYPRTLLVSRGRCQCSTKISNIPKPKQTRQTHQKRPKQRRPMFQFSFNGGSRNIGSQETEKFLPFFLVNGREILVYPLIKQGLIKKNEEHADDSTMSSYITPFPHIKLFLYNSGFGKPKRVYSVYMQLREAPAPMVTIKPLIGVGSYMFKGRVRFLENREVLSLIDKSEPSYNFVANGYNKIPISTLQSLVSIDRSEMRQGVRRIRM